MVGFRFASQIARRSIWRSRSTVQLNGILFERMFDGSSEVVGKWMGMKEVCNTVSSSEMSQEWRWKIASNSEQALWRKRETVAARIECRVHQFMLARTLAD
jgi:hypothetical protein